MAGAYEISKEKVSPCFRYGAQHFGEMSHLHVVPEHVHQPSLRHRMLDQGFRHKCWSGTRSEKAPTPFQVFTVVVADSPRGVPVLVEQTSAVDGLTADDKVARLPLPRWRDDHEAVAQRWDRPGGHRAALHYVRGSYRREAQLQPVGPSNAVVIREGDHTTARHAKGGVAGDPWAGLLGHDHSNARIGC